MAQTKTDTHRSAGDDLDALNWVDTYRMTVVHPRTGAPMIASDGQEQWIDVIGSQSDEIQALTKKWRDENRQLERKGKDITPERLEARELEILVTATKAWHLQVGGEMIPCTRETARDIYTRKGPAYVDLRRQVSVAVFREDHFMAEAMGEPKAA